MAARGADFNAKAQGIGSAEQSRKGGGAENRQGMLEREPMKPGIGTSRLPAPAASSPFRLS
jgi:hypothetical protein